MIGKGSREEALEEVLVPGDEAPSVGWAHKARRMGRTLGHRWNSATRKPREKVGGLARSVDGRECWRLLRMVVCTATGVLVWFCFLSSVLSIDIDRTETAVTVRFTRVSRSSIGSEWVEPVEGNSVGLSREHIVELPSAVASAAAGDSPFKNYNPKIRSSPLEGLREDFNPAKPTLLGQTRWPIQVAVFRGKGAAIRSWRNIKHLLKCAGNSINATVIKNANLATVNRRDYDVFLIPGGEAGDMKEWHTQHGSDLRKTVRTFVRSGGGYVGICAGAYLGRGPFAMSPFRKASTTLGVGWFTNSKLSPWFEEEALWPMSRSTFDPELMYYANGPIFQELRPFDNPEIRDPKVILRTGEKSYLHIEHGPVPGTKAHNIRGRYNGNPIVTYNEFSHGKVVLSTVHPETNATNGIHSFEVTPTECGSPHGNLIVNMVLMAANRTSLPLIEDR